jgi:transposase
VVADGKGIPMGMSLHATSPHEITLAEEALQAVKVPRKGCGRPKQKPKRLICDKAYDSDGFRKKLARRGIELIAPQKTNRKKPKVQDGRSLRRYRKRWKVERSIAWLGNYRRLVIRWDRDVMIYRAFFHIACLLITCNNL